jgi:hypothetical protein
MQRFVTFQQLSSDPTDKTLHTVELSSIDLVKRDHNQGVDYIAITPNNFIPISEDTFYKLFGLMSDNNRSQHINLLQPTI